MQSTILIADSGSTKTDWCLITNGKVKHYATQGINPYFLSEDEILFIFKSQLKINTTKISIDEIHFYGAGINSEDKKKVIHTCLKKHFNAKKINTHSDLLASVHATCLHNKGIACILGTGSNSCYFDGKKVGFKTPSLGYFLGDEGGGNYIGRKLLQHYFHGIFDKELTQAFDKKYNITQEEVLENIYRKPFPNRYLAQFCSFVFEHRGHYIIDNIAHDAVNYFFINHLIRYPQVHKVPVHFTGSVSFFLKDILEEMCHQYDIQLGTVLQRPIQKLAEYYR
jgi:N-acetylglucosamine kinase-like BadF-type ATPase